MISTVSDLTKKTVCSCVCNNKFINIATTNWVIGSVKQIFKSCFFELGIIHLINYIRYKISKTMFRLAEGKLKVYLSHTQRPPNFAGFWCNKYCIFSENGYIIKFLLNINSSKTISLHYSDGMSPLCKDDPYLQSPNSDYIMITQATRFKDEDEKNQYWKNPILCIPLDDEIFEFGLKAILERDCCDIYLPWEERQSIAFFRGTPVEPTRPKLVRRLYYNPNANARFIKTPWTDPHYYQQNFQYYDNRFDGSDPQPVTLNEHVRHKYLICVGGIIIGSMFNWVFGSGSVPILVLHPSDKWWFKQYIVPYVHYIPVDYDLSNLETNIEFLIKNDRFAQQIATNARKLADEIFTSRFQKQYLLDHLM